MKIEEFALNLLQDVHTEAHAEGNLLETIFFEKASEYLTESGELDVADRIYYRSGNSRIRVDGCGGDPIESSGTLSLIISDPHVSESPEKTGKLTESEIEKQFKKLLSFLEKSLDEQWRNSLEEASPAFGLSDMIAQRWGNVRKVRLFLISNRKLSDRVDGRPAAKFKGREVTYSVWDLRRLHAFATSSSEREDMEVDLKNDFGGSIPVLPANQDTDDYESYLAVIPGEVLSKIYDRWGVRLLEQNVRVFLQARGNVNRGMRQTLEQEPTLFFAYNNGITATAEAIEVSKAGGQILLHQLKNFQIVNGGQTTASIHLAWTRDVDISKTFVQMKLSVVSAELADSLVPKISQYANSQNRVTAADFFSNHPFHIRMENFSRRIYAPSQDGSFRQSLWFYERARGQFANARGYLTQSKRKKFDLENPRKQLFTKTDLAKFINVWRHLPHIVSKGAQTNFAKFAGDIGRDWERSPDSFNEAWYRQAIAKAIVFRETERIVTDQTWYSGGYRANIVAYSIAKIASEVSKRKLSVDFESIWRRQTMSSAMEKSITDVAKLVHEDITNPPENLVNVTQWAKQEGCWDSVKGLEYELLPDFVEELITSEEQKSEAREAQRSQRELNGIEAQIKVVEKGSQYWESALTWGVSRNLLSPMETEIFKVATRNSPPPTDKQSITILQTLAKLVEEGFEAPSES